MERDSWVVINASPKGSAITSEDGKYRYVLNRHIDHKPNGLSVVFIMLNPSFADASVDDPTIRRCIDYTRQWEASTLTVLNLFALKSTDPRLLAKSRDPIGPENDKFIRKMLSNRNNQLVVCAWGAQGTLYFRDLEVLDLLKEYDVEPRVLKQTKQGYPCHPLYLPKDLKPVLMRT